MGDIKKLTRNTLEKTLQGWTCVQVHLQQQVWNSQRFPNGAIIGKAQLEEIAAPERKRYCEFYYWNGQVFLL